MKHTFGRFLPVCLRKYSTSSRLSSSYGSAAPPMAMICRFMRRRSSFLHGPGGRRLCAPPGVTSPKGPLFRPSARAANRNDLPLHSVRQTLLDGPEQLLELERLGDV